ncbi:amino acid aminotransferase [Dongshaea marina]|uniref:amino acid aminotransferase n=1 Tax=Dongshaea marina TaxID=2047966 RepID=UPI000D3E42FD|nr:amino acid aminotransferase [Dongshaea marina]
MFETIESAPADPILGLAEAFRRDTRENKINLGAGIFKDDQGKTPVLPSVKIAEQRLVEGEQSKSYLPIEGDVEYGRLIRELLLGADSSVLQAGRARTAQTPGGTGALKVAADFIARQLPSKRIWISRPSWANHIKIFEAAGLEVKFYTYYDAEQHNLDFAGMKESLAAVKAGDVVLFHGCCHNPTGIDPTLEQWQELAEMSQQGGWLPLFDFAYQGFSTGLEADTQGLRIFAKLHDELLIASSCSKNFSLYKERVGAFTLIAADSEEAERSFSQVKSIIRSNYSNPPAHGAAVVRVILDDPKLRTQWEQELAEMRERIHQMRELMVAKLREHGATADYSFICQQNGMFSFSGLNLQQVTRLKEEFGIYMVDSGRISVAGINPGNVDTLCKAIAQVL